MIIRQFEDKGLSHYSYAIICGSEMALVDPERDPQPYYDFAKENHATITAVFETHPHADFISSHAEVSRHTGATVYVSKLLGAEYPFQPFDEGASVRLGEVEFKSLNTPGHSPDSICIVAYENGKAAAVFTGDTLFIGDCGRPDLREKAGALTDARENLAKKMYHSLRDKLMTLPDDVKVYPTHGAGSLCGRGLSEQNVSTIGAEKVTNWSLGNLTEAEFVKELLFNQPFVPKYFGHSVELNKKGAPDYKSSTEKIKIENGIPENTNGTLIIDTREQGVFKKGFVAGSINIMENGKFETWLGSIVNPGEKFSLIVESKDMAHKIIRSAAKIGYEYMIQSVNVAGSINGKSQLPVNLDDFRAHPEHYTILDIRNQNEVNDKKIFAHSLSIPLPELRDRLTEIPTEKPIVVHCAAGYRSAAGASILDGYFKGKETIYDLGEAVKEF